LPVPKIPSAQAGEAVRFRRPSEVVALLRAARYEMMSAVLLRLAYLGMTNVFALLRLLPVSDRDKVVEILALRHQIVVLERQLGQDPAAVPA
jgi:hypothetical protein